MTRASRAASRTAVAIAAAAALLLAVRHFRAAALPAAVPTAVAQQGEFLVTVTMRGSLAPQRSVDMNAPDISGLRITWLAPRGGIVKPGDPIARFDSSTARQALDAKTAALRQAQAALAQAQATALIADQQDALDLATDQNGVASAQLDASKAAVVSAIDGDESRLALGMAEEKLKVERATIVAHQTSNQAKVASAQSLRDKAQADLDLVNRQLKQMQLVTPVAGVVNYLTNYSQGYNNAQDFKVGDSVWPSATIAEIPDLSTLVLLAKITEVDRGKVALGEAVRARLDALPELELQGKVTTLSALSEVDFSGVFPPPRVFRLDATLDRMDPRLRPDMNGSVDIVTQRLPQAISIPAAAIFTVQGKPVAYVERGGRFQAAPITVLARNPDAAAIAGLAVGARVALRDPAATEKRP